MTPAPETKGREGGLGNSTKSRLDDDDDDDDDTTIPFSFSGRIASDSNSCRSCFLFNGSFWESGRTVLESFKGSSSEELKQQVVCQ